MDRKLQDAGWFHAFSEDLKMFIYTKNGISVHLTMENIESFAIEGKEIDDFIEILEQKANQNNNKTTKHNFKDFYEVFLDNV